MDPKLVFVGSVLVIELLVGVFLVWWIRKVWKSSYYSTFLGDSIIYGFGIVAVMLGVFWIMVAFVEKTGLADKYGIITTIGVYTK